VGGRGGEDGGEGTERGEVEDSAGEYGGFVGGGDLKCRLGGRGGVREDVLWWRGGGY
jgi:hypothetical protein